MGSSTCGKPLVAMVVVQFIYAGMALSAKPAFKAGMSVMVFVLYRQAIATIVLVPTAIMAKRGRTTELALGLRGFSLVFVAAIVGATLNQYLYYWGLDLSSPAMATAMTNLIPAITFVMAASLGLEKLKWGSLRSMAKVFGTIICVGGAMILATFKGPKLFNNMMMFNLSSITGEWLIGSIFLMASACSWSIWLILQVPICKNYLDPLSLSAWMCLLSTFQSFVITLVTEPSLEAWKIDSVLKLCYCLFAGIFGSGVTFYLQSWSIAIRGPLFSALFNPLSTVITTIFGFVLLHEVLHIGSVMGAVTVVVGLYTVLWGKAKDTGTSIEVASKDDPTTISIRIVDTQQSGSRNDLHESLLA